ncbi:MAG: glycosyltransferase [Chthoniobacter sp.]|nr:glycosyltransferase [Chthoniobacter sp.]
MHLETLYHLAILAGLLLGLGNVIANLACFDSLHPTAPPPAGEAPRVSILVPARNEALNIGTCARSLLAQDYPNFELLVLDDHSTDGTGDILQNLRSDDPRLRVLPGAALPPGWTGKGWACHQLAAQASGTFLFFADADTAHAPGTVSAAVAFAQRHRADLVSAWPRLLAVTWGERLIIPMILLLGMVMYPHWLLRFLQNHPHLAARLPVGARRILGAANGQFMFFRRAGYDRIGGHAAVRDHVVEDVALGRAVARRMGDGMRLFNCDALQFSTVRMYRSFAETWEGFTKNLRAAFEESLASFLVIGLWQVCGFLLPFAFAVFAPCPLVFTQIAVIYLIRIVLTRRFHTSWLSCVLHPVAQVLGLAIGLNSWRRSAGGGVSWKGRTYQVGNAP